MKVYRAVRNMTVGTDYENNITKIFVGTLFLVENYNYLPDGYFYSNEESLYGDYEEIHLKDLL